MVTFDSFFAFYVIGVRRNYLVTEKEGEIYYRLICSWRYVVP
jgi:hypothetical protein